MNAIETVSSPCDRIVATHRYSASSGVRRQQEPSAAGARDDADKIHQTCREMESLFLKQLLQEMRKTVPNGGHSGVGGGANMFSELMDSEFSKKLAEKGFGLAGILESQLMQRLRIENRTEEG